MSRDASADLPNRNKQVTSDGGLTDEAVAIFDIIVNFWVLFLVASFGAMANILVLAIFFRQGFRDGVNISLTSIVMWDLVKCACIIVNRMERPIHLISPATAESWFNVTVIYTEFLFIIACHVTYALASYVSVERCLYVSIPFKVRSIFTPAFTLQVVTFISGVGLTSHVVVLFLFRVVYVTSPAYNVTVADTTFTLFYQLHGQAVMAYYNTVGITLPLVSFFVLCIASLVTMFILRQASSKITRHTGHPAHAVADKHPEHTATISTTPSLKSRENSSTMSHKEKKVCKMLLVVLVLYIAILFPRQIYYIASLIQPEYTLFGTYHNIFVVSSKLLFLCDAVNAAINVCIFFKMSSNFRATMAHTFPCCS